MSTAKNITPEQVREAVNALKPSCMMLMAMAKKNITTKHGYGTVMQVLADYTPWKRAVLLNALAEHGYDRETCELIAQQDTKCFESYVFINSFLILT